jgi:hypothetical protein
MQWFYAQNGQQLGPISQTELDQLVTAGTVRRDTLVRHEGMGSWQPYGTVSAQPTASPGATLPPQIETMSCAECQRPFKKEDLLRFENLFVCATCKPIFFQKLQEGITPGGNAAFWRSGKHLVLRKDATLPARCVKCDADAPGEKLPRKLFWHHPAWYLLILPGLLIYAIIATIVGKRARIQIGVCSLHRQKRKRNLLIAWGLFLSSILCFILGGIYGIGWVIGLGIVAAIASPIYGMVTCSMVTPKKIDDQFVWLNGVSPKFLETLTEFPGR